MLKPYNKASLSFQLNEEIGEEGQNSQVFKAHDSQLDASLVIKRIPKKNAPREEFYIEASILHKSSHPNVVPINYACEDDDYVFLAMPFYSNGSLNKLINKKYLTIREIIKFTSQFLSGLHNIHSKKLIHFDIKPDNILISDSGEALLSDFGLSKPVSFTGLAEQDRGYMKTVPPEAFISDKHSIAYDIYQAGLTLYRMSMGNEEFYRQFSTYGDSPDNFDRNTFRFAVKNGRFPCRNNFLEHIPQALINVIKKSLATDPNNRYKAAIIMINGLADIDNNLLDWQYSEEPNGNRKWIKILDNKSTHLIIKNDGSSIAQKTISDRTQNIRKYCVESISRSKIKSFLKEY